MSTKQIWLDWRQPLLEAASKHLLSDYPEGPMDLSDTWIVVPTQEAARRFREALARQCANRPGGGGVLNARVSSPLSLLNLESLQPPVLAPELERLLLAEVMVDRSLSLSVGAESSVTLNSAWREAEMLQSIRSQLVEGGLDLQSFLKGHHEALDDVERYQQLVHVEQAFLAVCKKRGLQDSVSARLQRMQTPSLPADLKRLLVIGVPDPAQVVVNMLENLTTAQPELDLQLWIAAPASHAAGFDMWGRPKPGYWEGRPMPLADEQIHLCATPGDQADAVLELIAAAADDLGPRDLAFGVPDRSIIPALDATLNGAGLTSTDPSPRSAEGHRLLTFLRSWLSLVAYGRIEDLQHLFHHPSFLRLIAKDVTLPPVDAETPSAPLTGPVLLRAWDELTRRHLPTKLSDLTRLMSKGRYTFLADTHPGNRETRKLGPVFAWLDQRIKTFQNGVLIDSVYLLLDEAFGHEMLKADDEQDQLFAELAEAVTRQVRHVHSLDPKAKGASKERIEILLLLLQSLQLQAPPNQDAIPLEGWLELAWNDAPMLLVAGFNDGMVPESLRADPFLPDHLRKTIGLRDDAMRLARDAYLLRFLIESREAGRVNLVLGKTSREGDVLKPSRLLFQTADEDLPARAARLFCEVTPRQRPAARDIRIRYQPFREGMASPITRLRVTDFRTYLACPFRFYLKRVIGMEASDNSKIEPDARDYGNILHEVLELLGLDQVMKRCTDPEILRPWLHKHLYERVTRQYGPTPSVTLDLIFAGMERRLDAFMKDHIQILNDGWETIAVEYPFAVDVDVNTTHHGLQSLPLRGTIDRVDYHPETKRLRLIDYKTHDQMTGHKPKDAHLKKLKDAEEDWRFAAGKEAGGPCIFQDLQLPLYAQFAGTFDRDIEETELAYFILGATPDDTGLVLFEEWAHPELRERANVVMQEVTRRVIDGVFLPPADRVKYDDFADTLFRHGIDPIVEFPA